ncbi:MAG: hypothetical protein EBQ78_07130 [Betaproteobacteria bacterium]|nr:hypothetical protein [Betaproteobacteria bacterium]
MPALLGALPTLAGAQAGERTPIYQRLLPGDGLVGTDESERPPVFEGLSEKVCKVSDHARSEAAGGGPCGPPCCWPGGIPGGLPGGIPGGRPVE